VTSDVGSDADFATKTFAELTRLSAEAAKVRARAPKHRTCPDVAPCRHCKAVLDAHRCINDHIDQLRGEPAIELESVDELRTASPECSLCGSGRYRNQMGALSCFTCDGHVSGQRWSPA